MRTNLLLDAKVVASKDQASADLGDEAAILNLKDGVYYSLDAVGAHIWNVIQEPRSVREIRETLLEEYDVGAERSVICKRGTALWRRGQKSTVRLLAVTHCGHRHLGEHAKAGDDGNRFIKVVVRNGKARRLL